MKKVLTLLIPFLLISCSNEVSPSSNQDVSTEKNTIEIIENVKSIDGDSKFSFAFEIPNGGSLNDIKWAFPYQDVYADMNYMIFGIYLDEGMTTKLKASQYYSYDKSYSTLYCDVRAYETINFGDYFEGTYKNNQGDVLTINDSFASGNVSHDIKYEFYINDEAKNNFDISIKNCYIFDDEHDKSDPLIYMEYDILHAFNVTYDAEGTPKLDRNYITLYCNSFNSFVESGDYDYSLFCYSRFSPIVEWDL